MTQTNRGRPPAPATSTATRGMILVVVAFLVGLMLLWKGGGDASEGAASDANLPDVTAPEGTDEVPADDGEAPPSTAVAPGELQVMVANGAGVRGLAGDVAGRLQNVGFPNTTAVDATQQVTATQIYFVEGLENDAVVIAGGLGFAADRVAPMPGAPPVTSLAENQVLVVLGPDAQSGEGDTAPG